VREESKRLCFYGFWLVCWLLWLALMGELMFDKIADTVLLMLVCYLYTVLIACISAKMDCF
jgi:hypothetical protein